MRITRFSVRNYKSLRHVEMHPQDLKVIVGATASGKTNLADFIDFVSEVYRHGLEVAIARKGGYENIAHRRMRRSKGAIEIDLCVKISAGDRGNFPRMLAPDLEVQHRFAFVAHGYSIRAEYEIVSEELIVDGTVDGVRSRMMRVLRKSGGEVNLELPPGYDAEAKSAADHQSMRRRFLDFPSLRHLLSRGERIQPTELVGSLAGRFSSGLQPFIQGVSNIRVFQLSPSKARKFGVPTPRPELVGTGENLPAVVDLLKKKNPEEWKSVLQAMRAILPKLKTIEVSYTSSRTLGLLFEEEGFGRPWGVDEVSDGTVQTLALLVAIFDPRYSALVIEEPENSVHPWIIRQILDACREASKTKQILMTTHSPIVMNAVRPEELWVMWRENGESHLSPVALLDAAFLDLWEGGEIPTFEYVDSGAIPKALPPAPTE
jgi:predicted ATPase